MYRNFGYKGYNQEPSDNVGTIHGVVEIEEQHQWRTEGSYQVSEGIKSFQLKQGSSPVSLSHNPNLDYTIPFMQNEEYYIHLEEVNSLTGGTTTRYWSIDSSSYDDMFQDQTGTITVDNATGLGTAVFRTRFVHWFTTQDTFLLRIRSGSTSGPILATFTLKVMLPTVAIQYFNAGGTLDSSQAALIEDQTDEKFTDFRLNIINIGENPSAGFSGKVKLQVASVTFGTASSDDVSFPTMPFDKDNGVVSSEARAPPGFTEKTSFDFTGFNINTDTVVEGTENFTLAINVYKDPVVGGTVAMPVIQLEILDTSTVAPSFTLTLRTGFSTNPLNRYQASELQYSYYDQQYTNFMSGYSSQLPNVYDGYVGEGTTIGFSVDTTTQNAGGRYYFEVEPVTTSTLGLADAPYNSQQNLAGYSGNVAPYLTPGQDIVPAKGHFTIDDTGAYSGNPDIDNTASMPAAYRNVERLNFNISADTFPQFPSSTTPGELHEGFRIKIYPENKTPPTLLGASGPYMVHSGNNDTGNDLTTQMTEITGNPANIELDIRIPSGVSSSDGDFAVRDFYVGPALNGQTKRIYISTKIDVSGVQGTLNDLAIGGLQILDLTQTNPVIKAMPISATHANRRWVISGTDPLTYSPTSDGYFETSQYGFVASNTDYELLSSNSLSTVASLPYVAMNDFTLPSTPNFVAGRWNVTGFNNYGTPTSGTGMAGGIDPATWNQAPHIRPLNPETMMPNNSEPQVAASSTVGHYYAEGDGIVDSNGGVGAWSNNDNAAIVFRTPQHTFSQGQVIRLCYAMTYDGKHEKDKLYIGVA